MSDTKSWMRRVRGAETPDLWSEIESRSHEAPPEPPARRSPRSRAAVMLVASIVILGLVLYALRDLGSQQPVAPLGPGEIVRYQLDGPPQPISVGEGAAWVDVGAGDPTQTQFVRIDASTGEQRIIHAPAGDWSAVGGGHAWLVCNYDTCSLGESSTQGDPNTGDVAGTTGSTIVRMDPQTGEILGATPLPGASSQIVGTPDGVWVTYYGGVAFIDGVGTVTKTFDVAANLIGTDGASLWVSRGFRGIESLDPQTGAVLHDVPFDDVCMMDVAAGTVWVASCQGSHDRLMGVDSTSGRILFNRQIDGEGQMRYANGVLWLAQWAPSNGETIRLVPFDPRTGASLAGAIEIPSEVSGRQRFESFGLFPPHIFFVVGEGSFWLTDFFTGEVIRMGVPDVAASETDATDPGPAGESFLPPYLAGGDGWYTFSSDPIEATQQVATIAWSSTIPIAQEDVRLNAAIPPSTITRLPKDGIVIAVEVMPSAFRDTSVPFPYADLSFDLANATERGPEAEEPPGDYAVLQAEDRDAATLVRVYFGSPSPSPQLVNRAQAELNTLQLPPACTVGGPGSYAVSASTTQGSPGEVITLTGAVPFQHEDGSFNESGEGHMVAWWNVAPEDWASAFTGASSPPPPAVEGEPIIQLGSAPMNMCSFDISLAVPGAAPGDYPVLVMQEAGGGGTLEDSFVVHVPAS